MFDRISFDPKIMGGRACIRGMRLTVSLLVNLVANGMTTEEILSEYPISKRKISGRRCSTRLPSPMKRSIPCRSRVDAVPGRHGSIPRLGRGATPPRARRASPQRGGAHRLPDDEILRLAQRERRVVLTFDLDFGDLLAAGAFSLPSVVIFRLLDQTPASVTPKLLHLLSERAQEIEEGAIVIVEDRRYRLRRLPIERAN